MVGSGKECPGEVWNGWAGCGLARFGKVVLGLVR
jgi:hypothetical protein